MSEAEEQNNKRPNGKGAGPTRSFDGSVLGPGGQIGPFRIEQELGRGGAGVVYLAHDTMLDRLVAIKSMPVELLDDHVAQTRFRREARILASLNHPNIATIHEELEEADRAVYLVLEYVPGETLGERIARGGLTVNETLSITCEIAEAISAAHGKGVIHRDLKPGNIRITPEGRTKVLDFGIAKRIGGRSPGRQTATVTEPGRIVGTPAYMSPEQARGDPADHRTDIWSLGCILYEMLTGKCPFPGQTASEALASVLTIDPDWEALPIEAGSDVRDIIRKCLAKDPAQRYQSAAELRQDLAECRQTRTAPARKPLDVPALLRLLLKPRIAAEIVLAVLLLMAATAWLIQRGMKIRWARAEAIARIEILAKQAQYLEAFRLAREAERYIPKDPVLAGLWPQISRTISVLSTPPGAEIYYQEHSNAAADWEYLGRSPLENARCPYGCYRWRAAKDGFEVAESVRAARPGSGTFPPQGLEELTFSLQEVDGPTSGMVQVSAPGLRVSLAYSDYGERSIKAPAFFIDKREVTNAEFKEFLDHGGYQTPDYWRHQFIKDGREMPWEEAVKQFRDRTGRDGPSTWEGGTYPEGQAEHPVSGVSWYEAAAYAEFVHKELPSVYHWSTAACIGQAAFIIPFSNFGSGGLAPVGTYRGMGSTGLYDMAGNVKEWCWNAVDESENLRYVLGGAWTEPEYMFLHADSRSPWDRSPTNGFRCLKYAGSRADVPGAVFRPVKSSFRDYTTFTPVPDEIFGVYLTLYSYDRTDPNGKVEATDDSSPYWRKERLTFDAAYGGETITACLFLPKGVEPPYQTVVLFPGSGSIRQDSSVSLQPGWMDYIVMSGRALMWPIYKGTFERRTDRTTDVPDATVSYRDWVIQMAKDLQISVDYLETRSDINTEKLAYLGFSWGGELAPIMLAVENRLKLGILLVGGSHGCPKLPEVEEFNFAPRVKVPVLMINGKHDPIFAVELSQKPFFEHLGTPSEDKKHVLYPGGHDILGTSGAQIQEDILSWIDHYFGPAE